MKEKIIGRERNYLDGFCFMVVTWEGIDIKVNKNLFIEMLWKWLLMKIFVRQFKIKINVKMYLIKIENIEELYIYII